MTQERTPVSPEAEAAEIYAACDRIDASAAKVAPEIQAKIDELSALMKTEIEALAAAREAGKREGLEEAIRILDALPRSLERVGISPNPWMDLRPVHAIVPTVDEGAAAIRAKLEGV